MNNTFNINRFGKVLKHDGLNFFPNMGLALAILWAIPVIFYLFVSLMPGHETHVFDAYSRIDTIDLILKITIIIAPARLYKYCNDQRQGISYAMLPASIFEKFLSMVIYCVIVTPIVYIAGALAIDSILALYNGPYEGFAVPIYFDKHAQLSYIVDEHNMAGVFDDSWTVFLNSLSPTFMSFLGMFGMLMLSSIFMFGNMIFKKHKTPKMIGILILLSIIFMILVINYVAHYETIFSNWNRETATDILERLIYITINVAFYLEIIVSALLLWGVYHKIKTQKY